MEKEKRLNKVSDEDITNDTLKKIEDVSHLEELEMEPLFNKEDNFIAGKESLSMYMDSLATCVPVSKEREREMFVALKNGDESMKEQIFLANARLVPYIVKRISKLVINTSSMGVEDLISAGNIGLMKAINLFEVEKGYRFTTYAYHWVFSFMERCFCNESNAIRIPVHVQSKFRKISQVQLKKESELNRVLDQDEILEIYKEITNNENNQNEMNQYNWCSSLVSLNQPVSTEGDTYLELGDHLVSEELSPETLVLNQVIREEIQEALYTLPPRNANVLKLRFGFDNEPPKTLEEIGQELGVTRERVRQIEANSIRMLRYNKKLKHLKEYLNVS